MANSFSKITDIVSKHAIAAAFVLIMVMIIVPFPAPLLDFMMIINLGLGFVILLTVLNTPKAATFSSFPRVILSITVFGIALNIRSTVFILANGHVGLNKFSAEMIKAFARIVAGGNLAIGLTVFVIIILFQVLVITKGSTRVTEVQARFALDAMPNKMFAVDSELQQGSLTDEQARDRKREIQGECDFYSAMDGASKFVSGNVKFGITVTVVNLVAGVVLSMVYFKMSFTDALKTFPMLTIGDGLLSQIPSMLLSLATAILVTGSSSSEKLNDTIKKEFSVSSSTYMISGAVLCFMGIIFLIMGGSVSLFCLLSLVGGATIYFGIRMNRTQLRQEIEKANETNTKAAAPAPGQEVVSPVVPLDPLCLEIGVALIDLVQASKGGELLGRITQIRREAGVDMGLVVPSIRIIDNMTLDPMEYSFKIRGIEKGRSKLKIGYYLCMNTGSVIEEMKGEPTVDPAFGVPAIWVPEDMRSEAERNGYSVIDPPTIIATHMTEIIRSHAAEILGREEVSKIITKIKETNPVVVSEVMDTHKYTYGEIEKILQGLLREQVSIRNIVQILETLANYGQYGHDPYFLIEKVREDLGAQICLQYVNPMDRKLSVLRLSDNWSQKILDNVYAPGNGATPRVSFDSDTSNKWIRCVSSAITQVREKNYMPIIMCPGEVRPLVRGAIERQMPGTVVLSINEIISAGNNVEIEILGEISE